MFETNITVEDFSNICRFCMTERTPKQQLKPIFDDKNLEWTSTLNEMIRLCLNINVRLKHLNISILNFI